MARLQPQIQTTEEGAGMARRRSARLHPQIQASEEGAGVTRRRSPRLHPQTQPSGDGPGVICRRSSPLHPQIEASEEGAGVNRRGTSPASLPDDDDMLREILLRLPPQPSSLPRASAVCKRWRGLVTDPKFHRQFYAYHRKPPLLGVFSLGVQGIVFDPILDPPDRIPPQRFSLGRHCSGSWDYNLLDCHHGLVLVKDYVHDDLLVCDPITGEQRWVSVPPEFKSHDVSGAVLCAADELGHVHGGCHSSPFKVVLVSVYYMEKHCAIASVYSSEAGIWGNVISTEAPYQIFYAGTPATLVGNVLYWLFGRDPTRMSDILVFDLDRQNLVVTVGPTVSNDLLHGDPQIIQAEDGAVGFAMLLPTRFQMWQRNVTCQGVATWVPWRTFEMHSILGPSIQIGGELKWMLGYDDVNDVIFVQASHGVYAVQLKSMELKKLYQAYSNSRIHPFTSFCIPGTFIDGRSNGAKMLHSTYDDCLV